MDTEAFVDRARISCVPFPQLVQIFLRSRHNEICQNPGKVRLKRAVVKVL